MPNRARKCSTPGCTTPGGTTGKCESHMRTARQRSDRKRGNSTQRGYTSPEHLAFRAAVLGKDPVCVLCHRAPSVVADHYPMSRKTLREYGLNPNDPGYGRGLCIPCDRLQTAQRTGEQGHRYR